MKYLGRIHDVKGDPVKLYEVDFYTFKASIVDSDDENEVYDTIIGNLDDMKRYFGSRIESILLSNRYEYQQAKKIKGELYKMMICQNESDCELEIKAEKMLFRISPKIIDEQKQFNVQVINEKNHIENSVHFGLAFSVLEYVKIKLTMDGNINNENSKDYAVYTLLETINML